MDCRVELAKNVILSGGSSMFEGFGDRLKSELIKLAPHFAEDFEILAPADRNLTVWKGASTFASLSTFASSLIAKAEYEEQGGNIVKRKCMQ